MKKFQELDKRKNSEVEDSITNVWEEKQIFLKTTENREGKEEFVFYDGPATANGMPGLHHMLAKVLKDTVCKYKTMKGYHVMRKAGWDTHGLPVEIEVEKELGFKGKTEIESYGIEAFNKKCRESVFRNESSFRKFTSKMGQFIDLDNPYVTYDNNFIETEWWILKKYFDEGLMYEGHKILPYCTRCGTGLASHEVAQGYKEISVDTVTVPMKIMGEDTYFLVWTTTPWTLLANVAICVNPKETYVKVSSRGYHFIVAKKLVDKVLGDDYEVVKEYLGTELEYIEYEQLLPFIGVKTKAFFTTCADYVTMDDGTGIVHIAPAFGADDYEVGRKYNLPVVNPVGEDGKYLEGPWAGTFVMDADIEVIKYLKANDKLFKKERMKHNYPHCWRCKTPLLYYSKPSWYLEVTKYKDKMIEENNKINWHPEFVGEKRFGNWLENLNDWAISRTRYWGTPLPIWRCSCGHDECIGSRKELVEKAVEEIDESVELHRPYVDNIHIKCSKCGKAMNRVPEVIDVWFDSGSMPFSQYHYPFENKELFESQFPADFIAEGIDQTRGWFYSLLAISTFVMGKSPYKNVLVNDMLLDKEGQKMSKSKGNGLNPFDLIETYGADTIRWYLLYVSPVWTPTKFDVDGLKEVHSKFFSTLKNTYNFFALYANTDDLDPRSFHVPIENRPEIDRWLLSKYHQLLKTVTENYDNYDLTAVVRMISDFVNEDLSNWYIRRNRRRFWANTLDDDKKAVYLTTYEVLLGLSQMIAPIVPFTSEEIYQKLTGELSVHCSDFPVVNEDYIKPEIEERMDLVRHLISLGRYVREESKIKVRQPISEALIDGANESLIRDLTPLIEEELNVKEVIFTKELTKYMDYMVKPNFKICGPIFGPKVKMFADTLLELSTEDMNILQNHGEINVMVDGNSYTVNHDMVDIRIQAKAGFNVAMEDNDFIILNTELNQDLLEEGMARELVSKVQQLRKSNDFDIVDRITIYYSCDTEFKHALEVHKDFIQNETLAIDIIEDNQLSSSYDLNGHAVLLDIKKQG